MDENCFVCLPKAEELFDLDEFAHASLFEEMEHLWDALALLPEYINSLPKKNFPALKAMFPKAHFIGSDSDITAVDCSIMPGACVDGEGGPVYLGAGVKLGPHAHIRGPALISDGCVIGCEVKNSIFLPGVKAKHFGYVGDSILGSRVNLGAGTVLADERMDGKDVCVPMRGEDALGNICKTLVPTGFHKFGAVLGDDVKTGANLVINPGTIVHKGAWLFRPGGWGPGIITKGAARLDRGHI